MKAIVCICLVLVATVAATGCTGTGEGSRVSAGASELQETLAAFSTGTQTLLDGADADVARAAAELGRTGPVGPVADAVLANLSRSEAFVVDAVTYGATGRIVAAKPGAFGSLVGTDVPGIPPGTDGAAYLGPYAPFAEGFSGVSLGHPVIGADRTATGGVAVAIRPEILLRGPADAARNGRALALYAVQTDGTILYADDPALIGGQASRPGSGLAGMASQITSTPSGASSHRPANAAGDRSVVWGTVGLHGTEWRLVVAQR